MLTGNYIVIDLETTGFSPQKNDIVELSAARFSGFEPTDTYSTLLNPPNGINYQASLVNGITEEMVKDAPSIADVIEDFLDFIADDRHIVGQNVQFDLGFLCWNGIHLSTRIYTIHDTMHIARRCLCSGEVRNHKLGTLCDYYNIKNTDAHRGLSDCIATGKLFARLVREMGDS